MYKCITLYIVISTPCEWTPGKPQQVVVHLGHGRHAARGAFSKVPCFWKLRPWMAKSLSYWCLVIGEWSRLGSGSIISISIDTIFRGFFTSIDLLFWSILMLGFFCIGDPSPYSNSSQSSQQPPATHPFLESELHISTLWETNIAIENDHL